MLLRFLTLVLLFSALCKCEDNGHDHHEHGHGEENVFEKILDHINTTLKSADGHRLINRANLEKLLTDLNFRNCTDEETSSTCNLVSDKLSTTSQFSKRFRFQILFFLLTKILLCTVCKNKKRNTKEKPHDKKWLYKSKHIQTNAKLCMQNCLFIK